MTFAAPEAVGSGLPYTITEVEGRPATAFADFVGEVSFLVQLRRGICRVAGSGVLVSPGVRFYQKDVDHDGKDIRVWQIRAVPGNVFVAEHEAGPL